MYIDRFRVEKNKGMGPKIFFNVYVSAELGKRPQLILLMTVIKISLCNPSV
jgi:hypothetical protein